MKKKVTWMMTALLLSICQAQAQSSCNDLNGYVNYKNTNATSYYHLEIGKEEYGAQTYLFKGPGLLNSVKLYGNYTGLGGGVPLRVSICNVDANKRPTTVIKTVKTTWWKFYNNEGHMNVYFPWGGVPINNNFAITVQVLNEFPFGNSFDLKYTGDGDGKQQDLASLAGISTGFNWTSALSSFEKDGDFYLIPKIQHFSNAFFDPFQHCTDVNQTINFNNTSIVNTDSMFNKILLHNYSGTQHLYTWNFGDGSPLSHDKNPSHAYANPGTYTITLITSIDGWEGVCSKSFSRSVSVGLNLGISSTIPVACNGANNGSVTLTATGGAPTYSYSKDGVNYQTNPVFGNLTAGNYVFYVKDQLGCIKTKAVSVLQPDAINLLTISSTNASCGNADGSIFIAASGGVGTLQYKLNGGNYQLSGSFLNLGIGVYTVTIKDANQCTKIISVPVNDLGGPQITNINTTQVSCNGSNDGSIQITSSGGTGTVSYSIDGGLNYQTSTSFPQVNAGNYNIVIKDATGCTDITTVSIQEPAKLSMGIETRDAYCYGSKDGQIKVISSTGGIGAHRYSIDDTYYQSDKTFPGLSAGKYVVYLRDITGCKVSDTVLIGHPDPLQLSTTTKSVTCFGGFDGGISTFGSGGTGDYKYSINNGLSYQYINHFDELNAGSYTITIIDENLCTHTDTVIVTESTLITTTITTTNSLCSNSNGGLLVTASGGAGNYTYSVDGINYNNTGAFNPLASGTYYIITKDQSNCQVISTATIKDSDGPEIVSLSSTDATCNGSNNGSISVNEVSGGSGVLKYSINGHNWQTGHDFYGLYAGNYTAMVKDGLGCITTQTVAVTQPNAIAINPVVTHATCHGSNGSVSVAAAGGSGILAYSVTEGYIFQSSPVFSLPAGTYTVIVKDASNCSGAKDFTIQEPNEIHISATVLNVSCNNADDGAIIVYAGGGTGMLKYSLDGSSYSTSYAFTGLEGGTTYTVYVKDASNCIKTNPVWVYEPQVIQVQSSVTDVTCAGGNNGTINLSVNGGTFPYQYNWSTGQTTQGIFNLEEGNYAVIVHDFNGCQKQLTFTIDEPQNPLIVNAVSTDASSNSANDGAIDITVTGGVYPYSFQWSNGSTSEDLSALLPGAYLITITDANGCVTSATFIVNGPVGIENFNSTNQDVLVYPNPANESVIINGKTQKFDKIQVLNVLGQEVYSTSDKREQIIINTSALETGVYLIKLYQGDKTFTKRITVNH